MEKPVRYLLVILLGLAVIVGASGFSFIVHHCFTGNHTEVSVKGGHSDGCCHNPDHEQESNVENCCHEKNQKENQKPITELSHKCCEEGLLSLALQPVITQNSSSEIFQNLSAVTVFETITIQGISEVLHATSNYFPPPKHPGRHILLVNQIFLL